MFGRSTGEKQLPAEWHRSPCKIPKQSSQDENKYCFQKSKNQQQVSMLIHLAPVSYSYRLPEIKHFKNSGTMRNYQMHLAINTQNLFLCIRSLKLSSVFAKDNHLVSLASSI